jgi:hypothetical protein
MTASEIATTSSLILTAVSSGTGEKVPSGIATTPSLILTGLSSAATEGTTQKVPARRGTSNGNARGGSDARRRRREWLVLTYRADKDVVVIELAHGPLIVDVPLSSENAQPACRCYRCGQLLTVDTVTVDRIIPGCQGGTYARNNIRPACSTCNSSTGATTRRKTGRRS